jgi:cell division protein FtsZ
MSKEVFTTPKKHGTRTDLNAEKTVSDSEARVVFDLMKVCTPEAVVPVAGNEELMAMSEFIRNLDVSLKLFLLLRD